MSKSKRDPEQVRKWHEFRMEGCRRKMEYHATKLSNAKKSIALLIGKRAKEGEQTIYQMQAEINLQELLLYFIPHHTKHVERLEAKMRWLRGELEVVTVMG